MRRRLTREEMYPAGLGGIVVRSLRLRSGLCVRCLESGRPDGAPVLLIHGWGCSAYTFHANLAALAGAGYRVLAPDLKGHGLSDKPAAAAQYTLPAMTAHALEIMDALELERAAIVGQSLGGRIAIEVALAVPERVTLLALIAAAGLGRIRVASVARALLPSPMMGALSHLAPRWAFAAGLRFVFGMHPPAPRDVDEYWAPASDPAFVRSLLMLVRQFDFTLMPFERLHAIRQPVLVIWGAKDHLVSPSLLGELPTRIPRVRTMTIPGAGHVCNEEAPDEVNDALIRFLDEEEWHPVNPST